MSIRRVSTFLLGALIITAPLWIPLEVFAQEDGGGVGSWLMGGIARILETLIAALALFLEWTGKLLEHALNFTIFADYGNMEAINAGWTLLRDLINLVFVFLLLYIAISTIFSADSSGWRKQVVQIIVAVILVNFSLFLTGIVIDAGNILAMEFHEQVTTVCDPEPDCEEQSIALSFMHGVGIHEHFIEEAYSNIEGADAVGNSIKYSLIRIVFFLAVIWAFLSVLLLLLVRTIMLFILLVTAPIGVAGVNLPVINKHAERWRQELFKQTFVPVVFLFFVSLIISFIYETGIFSDPTDPTADGNSALSTEDIFATIMIVGFIIAAVRITKSLSGQAGKMIDGFGKAAVGFGAGVVTGGVAVGARRTIGMAAGRVKESEGLKARAAKGNRFARAALGTADSASKASFDPRSTKFAQFAGKKSGINFGKAGGKGGYEETVKTRAKEKEEFAESLGEDKAAVNALQPDIDSSQSRLETLKDEVSVLNEQKKGGTKIDEAELERKQRQQRQVQKRLKDLQDRQKAEKTKRQRQYAETLEKGSWWKHVRNAAKLGKVRDVDKQAADKIRKKIKQTDNEKFIDELTERIKGEGGDPQKGEEDENA